MISGNWDPGIGTSLWFNSEATGYDSDGWKVEFYSIQTGFDLELKKGISGSLRKIKIGSEWRMISTIINTESQLYEDEGYGTGKLGEYMDTALGSSRRERGKRIMELHVCI
ncbi:hypothetical protein HID58_006897 [Brassica napus]|uniref:Uncharacterized protein n=1 Tax=Brassica napus TaxID=3708 RepID=A0ABQ8ECN1_BRANA|nr:hypothetical protein HID58_006897 [Brassica napus]